MEVRAYYEAPSSQNTLTTYQAIMKQRCPVSRNGCGYRCACGMFLIYGHFPLMVVPRCLHKRGKGCVPPVGILFLV